MPREPIKPDDADLMSGHPAANRPISADPPTEPAEPAEPNDNGSPESEPQDEVSKLKARLTRQEEEMAELRRATPPTQPKSPPTATADPMDAVNWDEELFKDPKAALKKYGNIIATQVRDELTTRYQRDRGTQAFWDKFYQKNPDLKDDHDLVDLTLRSNLAEIGSMTVDKAIGRVADLTRDRILRYAGGAAKKGGGKKVVVEGSAPPAPRAPPEKDSKVVGIGDIIRARRQARRAIGS